MGADESGSACYQNVVGRGLIFVGIGHGVNGGSEMVGKLDEGML